MATVKIDQFGGIAPRQHPSLLPDGMATVAMNVKLESGKLVPLRQPEEVQGVKMLLEGGLLRQGDAKSMHIWRKNNGVFEFLLFPGVTWAATGNVANDGNDRLIVSGDRTGNGTVNAPTLYLRDNGRVERIPLKKNAIPRIRVCRCTISQGAITDVYDRPSSGNIRYARFFLTWVDKYGMESPVSLPSVHQKNVAASESTDVAYLDGETLHFFWYEAERGNVENVIPVVPTGESYPRVRIYKTTVGTTEGRIQFVGELSRATVLDANGFTLTISDGDLGETLEEVENAPNDLTCIHVVPGGYYCGFLSTNPKTVCFSDVNFLYSWPSHFRYDLEDRVVTLAVTSNTVFALTDGWPYALSGTAPESMTVARIANPAPCVSPRGMCVLNNTVFYASNAGLMAIANSANEGTVAQNVTDQLFTRDDWRALHPETCMLGRDRGRLFLYFPDAERDDMTGLTFNFKEGLKIALTQHDELARCICNDDSGGRLYYVRESLEGEGGV